MAQPWTGIPFTDKTVLRTQGDTHRPTLMAYIFLVPYKTEHKKTNKNSTKSNFKNTWRPWVIVSDSVNEPLRKQEYIIGTKTKSVQNKKYRVDKKFSLPCTPWPLNWFVFLDETAVLWGNIVRIIYCYHFCSRVNSRSLRQRKAVMTSQLPVWLGLHSNRIKNLGIISKKTDWFTNLLKFYSFIWSGVHELDTDYLTRILKHDIIL